MKIGVSTACLYPMHTEKSMKKLLDVGFENFEIFLNCFSEIEEPFINELKKLLDDYGANVNSVHPFTCLLEPMLFFSNYKRRFDDGVELYKKYFNAVSILGAENLIFHGQVGQEKVFTISDEEYFERYHKLFCVGKSFGVNLCQENIRSRKSAKVDFIEKMSKALGDEVRFTFDMKQANMEGESPFDMMRAMGDKICQVHVSDRTEDKPCLLPGDGERDFEKIINQLKIQNYDKFLTIEVYSNCFQDVKEFEKSKLLLKNFIF